MIIDRGIGARSLEGEDDKSLESRSLTEISVWPIVVVSYAYSHRKGRKILLQILDLIDVRIGSVAPAEHPEPLGYGLSSFEIITVVYGEIHFR